MEPPAPLSATSDCFPALKCWGPPKRQGLHSHPAHLWATSYSFPRFEVLGTPHTGRGYVATRS